MDQDTSPIPPLSEVKPEVNQPASHQLKKLIVCIVAAIILIPIITLGLCIYVFNLRNSTIDSIAHVVPLPVAIVDGQWVSYAEWRDGVATVNHFYSQQAELGLTGSLPDLTAEQIESNELDRLVGRALLKELASQYDLTVTQEEIDQEYQTTILPQATDEAEIANTIQTMYGWTIDQFKQQVVQEVVLRQKLQSAMNADTTLNGDAKEKIDSAKAELDGGAVFADVAKKYSDDGSAQDGGDLSWVEKGQTVPEFESVAFATEVGKVSEIFTSEYGYHILTVLETGKDKVHVAHILAQFISIDDQLRAMRLTSRIKNLVKVVDLSNTPLDNTDSN